MLRHVRVKTAHTPDSVEREYREAEHAPYSTMIVEYTALYGAKPSGVK
jgi:hypothetical protein